MMAWMPRTLIACWVLLCWAQVADAGDSARPAARRQASAGGVRHRLPVRLVQLPDRARAPTTAAGTAPRPASGPANGFLSGAAPIPLPPPRATSKRARESGAAAQPPGGRRNMAMVVTSSLAIVLGLFFLVVWLSRRALPKAGQALPTEALEVLGRTPLAARHNLQLIRLGHRLLLVSVAPDTARTLLDITDADEVNHLIALCRQDQPGSITASFRQVMQQMSHSAGSSLIDGDATSMAATAARSTADRR